MFTYEVQDMKEYPMDGLHEGYHVMYQKVKKCAAEYVEGTQSIREIECEVKEEVCLFREASPYHSLIKVACYILGKHVNNPDEACAKIRKEHPQFFLQAEVE